MTSLSLKQIAFLDRMAASEEDEETGFRILTERPDAPAFLGELLERGFLNPSKNKGPKPSGREGLVHIPYWPGLGYLEACAKYAVDQGNEALGRQLVDIVFRMSTGSEQPVDNYHTNREFAEIIASMPIEWIDDRLLEMVPIWLNSRFDTGGVVVELTRLVKKLSASESYYASNLALGIVEACTALKTASPDGIEKVVLVADEYWVNELVAKSSASLGRKMGGPLCRLFLDRIAEVYGREDRRMSSPFYRPAIEDHEQNHDWSTLDNIFVVGLRDALLSWVQSDAEHATSFVFELVQSSVGIAQRIGVYTTNQCWDRVGPMYDDLLPYLRFSPENFHELYWLLRDRFGLLEQSSRDATLRAISISITEINADADSAIKAEADYLAALAGQGYGDVEARRAELIAQGAHAEVGEHPDFYVYSESFWGHGNTPFQPQELLAFVANGTFVDRVNGFSGSGDWRGPTLRGLVDGIVDAVVMSPVDFIPVLADESELNRTCQYAIVSGFKKLWDDSERVYDAKLWEGVWETVLDFSLRAFGSDDIWDRDAQQRDDLAPTARWIPSLVADFIRGVMASDERPLARLLQERVLEVVAALLERSEPMPSPSDDAMTAAINSERGRALEAFFALALRRARDGKKDGASESWGWDSLEPYLDREFSGAVEPSFEAVTLCAAYLANLLFLSEAWLQGNIAKLFPADPEKLAAAKDGIAYARLSRRLYRLVRSEGRIRRMLELRSSRDRSHENLLHHLALGYLWGEELLDGDVIAWLFDAERVTDLATIAKFLARVRDSSMDSTVIDRVFAFWEKCQGILLRGDDTSTEIGAALAGMSVYVTSLEGRQLALMRSVAPYSGRRRGYAFVEDLERLVSSAPQAASELLGLALSGAIPDYDYQGRIKNLLRALAEHGHRADAARYADVLRHLDGMRELYRELAA